MYKRSTTKLTVFNILLMNFCSFSERDVKVKNNIEQNEFVQTNMKIEIILSNSNTNQILPLNTFSGNNIYSNQYF